MLMIKIRYLTKTKNRSKIMELAYEVVTTSDPQVLAVDGILDEQE